MRFVIDVGFNGFKTLPNSTDPTQSRSSEPQHPLRRLKKMPKLHDVKPHPAFNIAICPRYRTMGTQPFGSYQGKTGQPHYPHSYLENLMPVARTIDAPHDVAGVAATTFVGMMGSMLIALLNPTWLFDSMGLGLGAFLTSTRETIYLRRVLLMAVGVARSDEWVPAWSIYSNPLNPSIAKPPHQTLLGSHGLAGAFAAHLRGLLFGTDQSEMVHCKIGEWQSHTAHQQSLLQAFKPAIFTRILLMFVQVGHPSVL